jgi:hypothetical protein
MTEEQLAAKVPMRKKLASLSFSDKIKVLEKLRDREKALATAGLRRDKSKCGVCRRGRRFRILTALRSVSIVRER